MMATTVNMMLTKQNEGSGLERKETLRLMHIGQNLQFFFTSFFPILYPSTEAGKSM